MEETFGTLSLKIARLEKYLNLLKTQQALSQTYPDYQAQLAAKELNVRLQLDQLMQIKAQASDIATIGGPVWAEH